MAAFELKSLPGTDNVDRTNVKTWRSTLDSCWCSLPVCCCSTLFAPCMTCHLAQRMGERTYCCLGLCYPCSIVLMRTRLRSQSNIQGTILNDFLCTKFCLPFVMCQLARELEEMGL